MQSLEAQEKKNATFYQSGIIKIFSLVGMSITGIMAVVAFFNLTILLGIVLTISSILFYIGYYSLRVNNNIKLSSNIVLYSLYSLMLFLIFDGGVENTGPVWIYIVSPVSLFIFGFRKGMVNILIFIFLVAIILYFPQDIISHAYYSDELKIRLILSFLTVTFLSALYESSRTQSYKHILNLSKKYEQLARFDSLTKLSNRRDALNILHYEQKKIRRSHQTMGLILCDIDYFKKINDKYGHSMGDKTLTELSKLFKALVREQDCIARWGGEEFLFIFPETTVEHTYMIALKIQAALHKHEIKFKDKKIKVTVSMGISKLDHQKTIDEAINTADKFLYQAKNAGRDEILPQFN